MGVFLYAIDYRRLPSVKWLETGEGDLAAFLEAPVFKRLRQFQLIKQTFHINNYTLLLTAERLEQFLQSHIRICAVSHRNDQPIDILQIVPLDQMYSVFF